MHQCLTQLAWSSSEGSTVMCPGNKSTLKSLNVYICVVEGLTSKRFSRARCSFVVRAFAHGVMGCQIDPSWRTH